MEEIIIGSLILATIGAIVINNHIKEKEAKYNGFSMNQYKMFLLYKREISKKYDIEMDLIDDHKVYKNFLELLDEI